MYRGHPIQNVTVAEVQPDLKRLFLVVSGMRSRTGEPWTLVLERQNDYWISRRDLAVALEPAAAVSGYLFSREGYQDPVELLRRVNEGVRTEYYRLLQEKMQAERNRVALVAELERLKGELEILRRPRPRMDRRGGAGRRSPVDRKRSSRSRRRRP